MYKYMYMYTSYHCCSLRCNSQVNFRTEIPAGTYIGLPFRCLHCSLINNKAWKVGRRATITTDYGLIIKPGFPFAGKYITTTGIHDGKVTALTTYICL